MIDLTGRWSKGHQCEGCALQCVVVQKALYDVLKCLNPTWCGLDRNILVNAYKSQVFSWNRYSPLIMDNPNPRPNVCWLNVSGENLVE